jgi:hypothetical protein
MVEGGNRQCEFGSVAIGQQQHGQAAGSCRPDDLQPLDRRSGSMLPGLIFTARQFENERAAAGRSAMQLVRGAARERAHSAAGRLEEAEQAMEQALALDPGLGLAHGFAGYNAAFRRRRPSRVVRSPDQRKGGPSGRVARFRRLDCVPAIYAARQSTPRCGRAEARRSRRKTEKYFAAGPFDQDALPARPPAASRRRDRAPVFDKIRGLGIAG